MQHPQCHHYRNHRAPVAHPRLWHSHVSKTLSFDVFIMIVRPHMALRRATLSSLFPSRTFCLLLQAKAQERQLHSQTLEAVGMLVPLLRCVPLFPRQNYPMGHRDCARDWASTRLLAQATLSVLKSCSSAVRVVGEGNFLLSVRFFHSCCLLRYTSHVRG